MPVFLKQTELDNFLKPGELPGSSPVYQLGTVFNKTVHLVPAVNLPADTVKVETIGSVAFTGLGRAVKTVENHQ
jgi:hypothetical protein